jgi:hypothetical protein
MQPDQILKEEEHRLTSYEDFKQAITEEDPYFDRYDVFEAWTKERENQKECLSTVGVHTVIAITNTEKEITLTLPKAVRSNHRFLVKIYVCDRVIVKEGAEQKTISVKFRNRKKANGSYKNTNMRFFS